MYSKYLTLLFVKEEKILIVNFKNCSELSVFLTQIVAL